MIYKYLETVDLICKNRYNITSTLIFHSSNRFSCCYFSATHTRNSFEQLCELGFRWKLTWKIYLVNQFIRGIEIEIEIEMENVKQIRKHIQKPFKWNLVHNCVCILFYFSPVQNRDKR